MSVLLPFVHLSRTRHDFDHLLTPSFVFCLYDRRFALLDGPLVTRPWYVNSILPVFSIRYGRRHPLPMAHECALRLVSLLKRHPRLRQNPTPEGSKEYFSAL